MISPNPICMRPNMEALTAYLLCSITSVGEFNTYFDSHPIKERCIRSLLVASQAYCESKPCQDQWFNRHTVSQGSGAELRCPKIGSQWGHPNSVLSHSYVIIPSISHWLVGVEESLWLTSRGSHRQECTAHGCTVLCGRQPSNDAVGKVYFRCNSCLLLNLCWTGELSPAVLVAWDRIRVTNRNQRLGFEI